jgi:phosphatidate phosphatase LPIN
MIIEEQMDKVVTKMDPYLKTVTEAGNEESLKETPVPDDQLIDNDPTPPQIYPMDDGAMIERIIPEAITTTTVAKERFIVRPAGGDLYSIWMDVTHSSVQKEELPITAKTDEEHGKGDESIVLDIAGYKTGGANDDWDDEDETKEVLEKEMVGKLLAPGDTIVQSPLATDTEKQAEILTENTEKTESDEPEKEQESPKIDNRLAEEPTVEETKVEEEPKRSLWGWGSTRRQATNDSLQTPSSSPPPSLKKEPEIKEDKQGDLELLPGQSYRIEMSLCGFSAFGKDEAENAKVFEEYISTYDNFTHNPNMLNDKRLVFRHEGKYYAAGRTGPLFTSLLLFKKPLEEGGDQTDDNNSDSRESYQFGKGWRQWLSRSSVAAPTGSNNNHEEDNKETDNKESDNKVSKPQETTTFTTTTTTTSVGWAADHAHPGQEQTDEPFPGGQRKVYAKTLRLTSDQLKSLNLQKGANTISFSVSSAYQGTATCAAKIFYWDHGIQVVISDIDGTITKSDALGHVFTMIGKDWTHMGVAKLYTDIANNGYHFLYLTSRAIGQADYTRDYLKKVVQDKYQLPDGPVIMSPDRLFTSFHREVIMRKPEVFKMACLRDVQRLFGGRDPFYAGFGNRITDARSYRSVNVPTSRIFTIDPYGDLKLELLLGFKSSYIHLNDLVDQMFPPINRVVDEEFNDWNYWKAPVMDIEIPELDIPLEPTSPKPKPIKPDPSALPASSVVASSTSSSGRGLLRSFTSRADSNSSLNNSAASQQRKLQSSSSTTTLLKSRKYSISSNTSGDENLANDTEVAIDQKPVVAASGKEESLLSTSPPENSTSIMNKMRSTLSRTFLSSDTSNTSGSSTPKVIEEEKEQVENDNEKTLEEEDDHQKPNEKDNSNKQEIDQESIMKIQEDVDSLLDDIDMDDIPFI